MITFSILVPDGLVTVHVTFLPSSRIPKSRESTRMSALVCRQTPANTRMVISEEKLHGQAGNVASNRRKGK